MEASANLKAGGITPKIMKRELEGRFEETMNDYSSFMVESEQDLAQTMAELEQLKAELTKEQRITASLEEEKKMNDAQLDKLTYEYEREVKHFKQLEFEFDQKQRELDELRNRASIDAKKLALELGRA